MDKDEEASLADAAVATTLRVCRGEDLSSAGSAILLASPPPSWGREKMVALWLVSKGEGEFWSKFPVRPTN